MMVNGLRYSSSRLSANYFIINDPQLSTQWSNNAPNLITWSKGLRDGVHGFDVEMARLSKNGLSLVARNGAFVLVSRLRPF